MNDRDRGPPPVANSRFAAAADADRSTPFRDERGPPPVANSRFAAAAEADRSDFRDNRGDDRMNDRDRGAPPQNSRFAAAAAMDSDYVDREERQRRMADREQDRFDDDRGGNRHGGRDGGGRDDYERRGDDRRGDGRGSRGDDRGGYDGGDRGPRRNRVDDLLKPKVPVVADNILKAPDMKNMDAAHGDNMLMFPAKALSKDKEELAPPKKKEDVKPEDPAAPQPSAEDEAKLLKEFASGNKMGDDLKEWCATQGAQLPSVKMLVFHLLTEREKLNPDPNCAWADPSKFGAALSSLVQEDIGNQMQVLWGIQMYCDKLGFPKLDDEYVAQSMFRSMYKFDLAEADAFMEWKEDEADEHEQGKMKAVIQTVDWFNWLEEDDEEEEYEEEEE
jgi:hypothetical protein